MPYKIMKITDISEIEEIIERALICRLGLVDNDEPYVIPVNFGYKRGALYFHGSSKQRKMELIKKNNKVCFEVDIDVKLDKLGHTDNPCRWIMKGKSVIGVGTASILENDEEKTHALRAITKHYNKGDFSFPKSNLDSTSVVRVDITRITGKKIV